MTILFWSNAAAEILKVMKRSIQCNRGPENKIPRINYPLSSTSLAAFDVCREWLVSNEAMNLKGGSVRFGQSPGDSGFGCYATKNFSRGDLILEIPLTCLFGIENIDESSLLTTRIRAAAKMMGDSSRCTSELLLWLHMIQSRHCTESSHHPYMISLDKCSPSLLSWPPALREVFDKARPRMSTDVQAMLDSYNELLEAARKAFDTIGDETWLDKAIYNRKALLWAYGHYVSRRYPGEYSRGRSLVPDQCPDGREATLDRLGVLVPALDILNHGDADVEWLKLERSESTLRVICNVPRKAGEEMWSNYGNLSNERLLFAYGFSLKDNPDDEVALHLIVGSKEGLVDYGLSYLRRGGIQAVPPRVWRILSTMRDEDDEEGDGINVDDDDAAPVIDAFELGLLREYCQRLLTKVDAASGDKGVKEALAVYEQRGDVRVDYIRYYLKGQEDILRSLLAELSAALEEDEEEEDG